MNFTSDREELTKPNGMTLTQSCETTRNLIISMAYHRGNTLVTQREYTYDVLSRPTARTTSRQGNVVNDTFVHNTRSELASAQVNGETYGYDYDNVGNRRMSMEAGDYAFYEANALNQYTDIAGTEDEANFSFTPVFDADGNQTLIKTETGIWAAVYNAENRPVSFTNEATGTVVTCAYDSMGRRSFKKVTVNGTVTFHQRYIYRGYLQIACCDLTRTAHPCLWLITWDPMHTIATRPLAIQKDGTWYIYGLDLTKNVCELFGTTGYIATAYSYSPYGSVTSIGTVTQHVQWSSEYRDEETSLVYYNWRYYNPLSGRWNKRDLAKNSINSKNLYTLLNNQILQNMDYLGKENTAWVYPPKEEIFYFPVVDSEGEEAQFHVTEKNVYEFYTAAGKVNEKMINGKKCYSVKIYNRDAATIYQVLNADCDIIFLIGHGQLIQGKQVIYLKDGKLELDRIKNKECIPIGCYLGKNKAEITITNALLQLIDELNNLANNSECPGKVIHIYSGPLINRKTTS